LNPYPCIKFFYRLNRHVYREQFLCRERDENRGEMGQRGNGEKAKKLRGKRGRGQKGKTERGSPPSS
jgi:hypothetical protein